jgi:hypothetical protein
MADLRMQCMLRSETAPTMENAVKVDTMVASVRKMAATRTRPTKKRRV